MDEHTPPTTGDDAAAPDGSPRHGFKTPEGLRALLIRLHEAGPGAWRSDREAAELMRYTAERYRRLARKYGLDEWEVASEAFEVMLAPSTRNADNPWAVVTRAMKITCGVEVRAAGMLVSPSKVRHTARIVGFHDAIRFADRESLADYHPAFAVNSAIDDEEDFDGSDRARVAAVLSEIVGLFVSAGWDAVLVTVLLQSGGGVAVGDDLAGDRRCAWGEPSGRAQEAFQEGRSLDSYCREEVMSKFVRATQTSQVLSLMALEEASRQGLREADIDHLFLALVLSDEVAGRVLREMGIGIDDARRAVREQHDAQLASLGVRAVLPDPGRIVFHETDGYELKQRAADLIGRAGGKNWDGSAAAVLRELLGEPSGLIADILHRLDATPQEVLERLDRSVAVGVATAPEPSVSKGRAAGSQEIFVPAPVAQVWEFLTDPVRVPEWEVSVSQIETVIGEVRPGAVWEGRAPEARPDGKPVKIRPPFRRRLIELVTADRSHRVAWRFVYPDAPQSRPILTEFTLAPTTGGTQVTITTSWTRHTGWRRLVGVPLRPLQKLDLTPVW